MHAYNSLNTVHIVIMAELSPKTGWTHPTFRKGPLKFVDLSNVENAYSIWVPILCRVYYFRKKNFKDCLPTERFRPSFLSRFGHFQNFYIREWIFRTILWPESSWGMTMSVCSAFLCEILCRSFAVVSLITFPKLAELIPRWWTHPVLWYMKLCLWYGE